MEKKIAQILSQLLERNIEVDETVSIDTESNWDSVKHIEIVMTLEEEFNISFESEDIPQLTSMSKILEIVKKINQNVK